MQKWEESAVSICPPPLFSLWLPPFSMFIHHLFIFLTHSPLVVHACLFIFLALNASLAIHACLFIFLPSRMDYSSTWTLIPSGLDMIPGLKFGWWSIMAQNIQISPVFISMEACWTSPMHNSIQMALSSYIFFMRVVAPRVGFPRTQIWQLNSFLFMRYGGKTKQCAANMLCPMPLSWLEFNIFPCLIGLEFARDFLVEVIAQSLSYLLKLVSLKETSCNIRNNQRT